MGALHAPHAAGKPLKASQRRLGRARARGQPPAATTTPAPGSSVRYRGRDGVVERVDRDQVVVDFDGRLWSLPIAELEPI
jgi:hypothetical protein